MNDWIDQTAVAAETSLTHREVRRQGACIAHALTAAGVQSGEMVAVATSNRASFYTCFAGCFDAGFPVAVLDPLAATQELALMLQKAGPAALIADESVLKRLAGRADIGLPERAWRVAPSEPGGEEPWPSLADISTTAIDESVDPVDDEIPAYVMFTSGTTSTPKGVVVSRAALRHHVATLAAVFAYDPDARLLSFLPTHHTDGLVHGVAASLLIGMAVIQPGPFTQSTDIEQLLRTHQISHLLTVPTMLAMIMRSSGDRPDLFKYEEFRSLISTAGFLDERLWKEFQDCFGVRVSNFYGMTETVSGTLFCGPTDSTYQLGSLGRPIDAEVRIVDESGEAVASDTVGELHISGKHLMTEYLDDPEATKAVIKDGWLLTGDLFSQDKAGVFHFAGRLKNIIKRGGITVYPEDVRKVVSAVPGVLEVETIGIPDTVFEEIIAVCAVVESGVGAEDIRKACHEGLSPERRPDRIELMDNLPRGPSGKVRCDELIAALVEPSGNDRARPDLLREQVIRVAADTFVVEPSELDDTSSPETLTNWDSYAGMEFVLALEKEFALRLQPRDIMRISDIGKAIEIITAHVNADSVSR